MARTLQLATETTVGGAGGIRVPCAAILCRYVHGWLNFGKLFRPSSSFEQIE